MNKFFCHALIIIMCVFNFSLCNAIEPPDILKDHVANKKLSNTSIEELKTTIKKNTNDISAYKDLIKLQENAGLKNDAIDSYLMLALIYENLKMFDQAKSCYENALKLDPESELLRNKSKIVYAADTPAKSDYYPQEIKQNSPAAQPHFGSKVTSSKKSENKKNSGSALTQEQLFKIIDSGLGTTVEGNKVIEKAINEYKSQPRSNNE